MGGRRDNGQGYRAVRCVDVVIIKISEQELMGVSLLTTKFQCATKTQKVPNYNHKLLLMKQDRSILGNALTYLSKKECLMCIYRLVTLIN